MYIIPTVLELIWCYSSNNENSNFQGVVNGSDTPAYLVSDELVALYDYKKDAKVNKGDVRAGYFFTYYNVGNMVFNPITGTFTQKTAMYWGCHNYNSGDASKGFRTAEAYLNRAECYVRKFMQTGNDEYRKNALSDFNRLRASRWDGVYTDVDIQDADALWTFCREERRRELAFDDHRGSIYAVGACLESYIRLRLRKDNLWSMYLKRGINAMCYLFLKKHWTVTLPWYRTLNNITL